MNVFFNILILFFMISALQPVIKQEILKASRQNLISRIEKKTKSRVITLIHRQETMSVLGFPIMRYIDINDSEKVIRAIQTTDADTPISLILHTPGGIALAALQIARAIRAHKGKVTIYVPHYAMSGGTLIALAADEIALGEHSVLGPVDPQIDKYPAPSIVNVLKQKPMAEIDDETLILADISQKAINQLENGIINLLPETYPLEEKKRISDCLTRGHWTHDFPISVDVARELGLKVTTDVPPEVFKLMDLFPQPIRSTPSVEFGPGPNYPRGQKK
ncbi:MAG TPA: ATP-dependent Clp protease proteolytic subunit [Candidatus Saccharicenans sp.]|jgi:ClpP class serine protease|nr:ATP-dependent Clp protease proteolytic subunit [Candidatus Saccharicenans sp.]HRD02165.1 ATP-dependent Clp protease proteolytic subunit [Candidatus Saccharicenans sp.]